MLSGCYHLNVTLREVEVISKGADTFIGGTQLLIAEGALTSPSPLKLTPETLKE